MNDRKPLQPEDYLEPNCLLCGTPHGVTEEVRAIPQKRIIEKMDEYMSRRDYAGAERHLLYWLEEAKLGRDLRGQLLLRNELTGHFRKTGDKENALQNAEEALRLVGDLDFTGTVSAGTTYTNAATAYHAFGEHQRALALFEQARAVYESRPDTDPALLGGLYNNMALCCAALKDFPRSFSFYEKAMAAMEQVPGGKLEQAITCLNMANAVEDQLGMEQGEPRIYELLDQALELLRDKAAPRNGYYAFVCEKCAPTFSYYGYFLAAEELKEQAEAIYERT